MTSPNHPTVLEAVSIDQNCIPLWDTFIKVKTLQFHGIKTTHLVEDIDTAFTRVGSDFDKNHQPALTVEQYYPNGNLDWGATLFFMAPFGRCPLNLHNLEKLTGKKTATYARALDLSLEEFYAKYSIADNQQLTGSSYVEKSGQCHRLLGDLTFEETEPFLLNLIDLAEKQLSQVFPSTDSQQALAPYFETQRNEVKNFSKKDVFLTDFYQFWTDQYILDPGTDRTSNFFGPGSSRYKLTVELIQEINQRYPLFCQLYNDAIEETNSELSPLNPSSRELPFFVAYVYNGHRVRSTLTISEDGQLSAGFLRFSLDGETNYPILAITGKALLLVILARLGETAPALALPENGSLYTPTAHALTRKLLDHHFITQPLAPILRIKFNLLEQLNTSNQPFCPPPYLQEKLGTETTCRHFSELAPQIINEARQLLSQLENPDFREEYLKSRYALEVAQIEELKQKRAEYGRDPERRHLCREVWDEAKAIQKQLDANFFQHLVHLSHQADLDYWNSRGAIEAIALAAGGPQLLQKVIANAQIVIENAV